VKRDRAASEVSDADAAPHALTFFLSRGQRREVLAALDQQRKRLGLARTAGWRSRALTMALGVERIPKEPRA
jgi:hypothetical protein